MGRATRGLFKTTTMTSDIDKERARRGQRTCPACNTGYVLQEEIRYGARCSYCHATIEMDNLFSIGTPVALAIGWTIMFKLDWKFPGLLLVAASVLYSIRFYHITARWFPLREAPD